jgi:acylphosphatase
VTTPGSTGPGQAARVRLEAVVTGRVQGVGFRMFVLDEARELGLDGSVANLDDGSVSCIAEGPRASLEHLLGRLETGPRGARVAGVQARWSPARGVEPGFAIRSGRHPGD